MNYTKKGFTLAEMVMALAIVGIVAVLTIPALQSNINKKTLGAQVGKAVGNIQSGMINIFNQANQIDETGNITNSISALKIKDVLGNSAENGDTDLTSGDTLFSRLGNYIDVYSSNDTYTANIKLYSGDSSAGLGNFPKYKFAKQKTMIIVEPIDNNSIPNNIANDAVIARIYIDANGSNTPNRLGQDVFLFGLTDGGKLVPAGSAEYNKNALLQQNVLDEDGNKTYDEDGNEVFEYVVDPLPLYNDENGGDRCDSVINTGRTCAARLAADGWELKY